MNKIKLPDPKDSWAQVELWRWQYGTLPQSDDMRPLNVAAGLRGMAAAISKGDRTNFPSPRNVVAVLEYAAKVLSANAMGDSLPPQKGPAVCSPFTSRPVNDESSLRDAILHALAKLCRSGDTERFYNDVRFAVAAFDYNTKANIAVSGNGGEQ